MDSPFLGPTYDLNSRPASVQRTINLMPVPIEPGNERTSWVFKDVPGLTLFNEGTPAPLPAGTTEVVTHTLTGFGGYSEPSTRLGVPAYSQSPYLLHATALDNPNITVFRITPSGGYTTLGTFPNAFPVADAIFGNSDVSCYFNQSAGDARMYTGLGTVRTLTLPSNDVTRFCQFGGQVWVTRPGFAGLYRYATTGSAVATTNAAPGALFESLCTDGVTIWAATVALNFEGSDYQGSVYEFNASTLALITSYPGPVVKAAAVVVFINSDTGLLNYSAKEAPPTIKIYARSGGAWTQITNITSLPIDETAYNIISIPMMVADGEVVSIRATETGITVHGTT